MPSFMAFDLKTPTDRSRSDCVHEQVAKRIANIRFTQYKNDMSVKRSFATHSIRLPVKKYIPMEADGFLHKCSVCLFRQSFHLPPKREP